MERHSTPSSLPPHAVRLRAALEVSITHVLLCPLVDVVFDYTWPGYAIFRLGGLVDGCDSNQAYVLTVPPLRVAQSVVRGGWEAMAPLSTPRFGMAAATMDEKVYIVGGRTPDGSTMCLLECYDSVTRRWTVLASMSRPRLDHVAMVYGELLYVCGGDGGGYDTPEINACEVYSPATNKWRNIVSMRWARRGHRGVSHNGSLYCFGGYNTRTSERLQLSSGSLWSCIATPPTDSFTTVHGAVILSTNCIALMAARDLSTSPYHHVFMLLYAIESDVWSRSPWSSPGPRQSFSVHGLLDGRVAIAGGFSGVARYQSLDSCYIFSPTEATTITSPWHPLPKLPQPCARAAFC